MPPNRHVVHCLLCGKAETCLSTHLKRFCMKDATVAEQKAELQRAKESTKRWNLSARTWSYKDICRLIKDQKSRRGLVHYLRDKGFFVPDYYEDDEQPTTSRSTTPQPVARQTSVLPAATASTATCPDNAEEDISREDSSSKPSDSDPSGDQGTAGGPTMGASVPPSPENNSDPTWQK